MSGNKILSPFNFSDIFRSPLLWHFCCCILCAFLYLLNAKKATLVLTTKFALLYVYMYVFGRPRCTFVFGQGASVFHVI